MGSNLLAMASVAAGCATSRPALPLPPDVVEGFAVQRPAPGDARRYDLAA